MSAEEITVPTKVWLRGSTYRSLYTLATARHTTVGELLASLADRVVTPKQPGRRPRLTPEGLAQLVKLHAAGWHDSPIAHELHITPTTVANHRNRLGLPSNNPRKGATQ